MTDIKKAAPEGGKWWTIEDTVKICMLLLCFTLGFDFFHRGRSVQLLYLCLVFFWGGVAGAFKSLRIWMCAIGMLIAGVIHGC